MVAPPWGYLFDDVAAKVLYILADQILIHLLQSWRLWNSWRSWSSWPCWHYCCWLHWLHRYWHCCGYSSSSSLWCCWPAAVGCALWCSFVPEDNRDLSTCRGFVLYYVCVFQKDRPPVWVSHRWDSWARWWTRCPWARSERRGRWSWWYPAALSDPSLCWPSDSGIRCTPP